MEFTPLLKDGEYSGPVWTKAIFQIDSQHARKIEVLSWNFQSTDVIGVKPMGFAPSPEIDPFKLLIERDSLRRDRQIRIFYCQEVARNSIPTEVKALHAEFFSWLSC